MPPIFQRIKKSLNARYRKQRWLILVFSPEGLEVRKVLYYPTSRRVVGKAPMFFKDISEKNIRSKRILKIVLHILFFPFRYRIGVIAPKNVCRSKYFTIPFERKNHSLPIQKEEIGQVFSQYLWKCMDANKRKFAKDNGYDDLSVLLMNSQVASVTLDGKTLDDCDEVLGKTGKKVMVGMLQTFAYRSFFTSLSRVIPKKRALFKEFHEYGFQLPFAVLLAHLKSSTNKNKKFIFADIKENETRVTIFDGMMMSFYDTFGFGNRSFYEAMNHFVGVDYTAYIEILNKIVSGEITETAKKRFMAVLDKELVVLSNGISSFKKDARARTAYVNGEELTGYLDMHKRISEMLIFKNGCNTIASVNLKDVNLPNVFKADLGCMFGMSRNEQINIIATRQIRWLIPHNVDVR
jgi:hypothetical protein